MINRMRFLGCVVLVGLLSGCEPEEPGQTTRAETVRDSRSDLEPSAVQGYGGGRLALNPRHDIWL